MKNIPAGLVDDVMNCVTECGHFFSSDGEIERVVAHAISRERERCIRAVERTKILYPIHGKPGSREWWISQSRQSVCDHIKGVILGGGE